MTEKIAVVTDSTCDLSPEYIQENGIYVLPLKVIYRDKEYLDRIEITPKQIYDRLDQEVPSTSTPSVGEAVSMFDKLQNEGYNRIISIHVSSGLSGTFNTIQLAATNFPSLRIEVIDSKALSMAVGQMVMEAVESIQKGLDFNSIVDKINKIKKNMKVFFVVKTLEYLKRGGRIGYVAATMGSLLDLKPVISINEEGKYFTVGKVRGRKQSLHKMIEIIKEHVEKHNLKKLALVHANVVDEAKAVLEEIKKIKGIGELQFGEVGPAIGVHSGPGLIGVAFYPEA